MERYYGWQIDGMYQDRKNFFFSFLPAFGVERQEDFWVFQIIFLNMTFAVFTGLGEFDGDS